MKTENSRQTDVTQLLSAWQGGDANAFVEVSEIVHAELKRLAHGQMSGERSGHTLQTTALVNEAYLRIVDSDVDYQNRKHFMVVAAKMMRRILIDHARTRNRQKRGDGLQRVTFNEALDGQEAPSVTFCLLMRPCQNWPNLTSARLPSSSTSISRVSRPPRLPNCSRFRRAPLKERRSWRAPG